MKRGFTLAEVLITLLIIGVVAALTIPSVISNYQQMEFKTGLKKAVSILNEAIQTNIAQEGESPYENDDLSKYLQRHISVLSTFPYRNGSNQGFYTTDGMRFEFPHLQEGRKYILHETGISAEQGKPNPFGGGGSNNGYCGSYGLFSNTNSAITTPCIVLVDVNGDKKPNPPIPFIEGNQNFEYSYPMPGDKKLTDLFNILITDEKAIPFGVVAQRAMYSK